MAENKKAAALQRRLQREAELREQPVDDVREALVALGLGVAERRRKQEELAAEVLLITAGNAERDELLSEAAQRGLKIKKQSGEAATYYKIEGLPRWSVAALRLREMGSFTAKGSAFTCHRARVETGATSILLVGTAFGVDETAQRIGDVLVSESLFLYDDANVEDDTSGGYAYAYGPRAKVPADPAWLARCQNSMVSLTAEGTAAWKVHVGAFLTGGARIASGAFRDHLCARGRAAGITVVGGEMEAAGVAAVCTDDSLGWVAVKGVSDFATAASRAQITPNRVTAARNAAHFVFAMLK